MAFQSRLAWLQRNRSKPKRVEGVDSLMGQLAERLARVDTRSLVVISKALVGLVDEDFCEHCRIDSVARGALAINVSHRELVYPMRMKWQHALLRDLPGACAGVPIGLIRFQFGREGQPICVTEDSLEKAGGL